MEAADRRLYKLPIPTPIKLKDICANWFAILCHSKSTQTHPSLMHWTEAFFINSDASEIGVGINILYQVKGKPQATKILSSKHFPLPADLQSLLSTHGESVIRPSCARETFGLAQATRDLQELIIENKLKTLPCFLYTDNLGTAFMFHSKHAKNYITQRYLTATLRTLHDFQQPFEIFN